MNDSTRMLILDYALATPEINESIALYRLHRLFLALLALALRLNRRGVPADLADHDLERDRLAEMLFQCRAQLFLIIALGQMPG